MEFQIREGKFLTNLKKKKKKRNYLNWHLSLLVIICTEGSGHRSSKHRLHTENRMSK